MSLLLCGLFSSCNRQGLVSSRGARLLLEEASLVAKHGLQGTPLQQLQLLGSRAQTQYSTHRGAQAYLFCNMWDLPGAGIEPVFPALSGRFFTIEPPGKPLRIICLMSLETAVLFFF